MATNVFISYSSHDLEKAVALKKHLEEQSDPKFDVFLAEQSVKVGDSLPQAISDALQRTEFFVLLWSRKSSESQWVLQELGRASAHGKKICPIVLEEGVNLPDTIRSLKYLKAFQGEQEVKRWVREELAEAARLNNLKTIGALLLIIAGLLWLLSRD